MNRIEFAEKSKTARRYATRLALAMFALVYVLLLGTSYIEIHFFRCSENEILRHYGGLSLVVINSLIVMFSWQYLTWRKGKGLGLSCASCGAVVKNKFSHMVVMTNICPECGKNAFEIE